MHDNMDKPNIHDVDPKKPHAKEYIIYVFNIYKVLKQTKRINIARSQKSDYHMGSGNQVGTLDWMLIMFVS